MGEAGEVGLVRDLRRYVPRIASEWDSETPWQELDGTLVFIDVSGFTNLSERLAAFGRIGAEELTDVLTDIFGAMLDVAAERGGSLLKFGGDALLLLFLGSRHAEHACSAAVEMRAALRAATGQRTSAGRLALRMSIGVHSGPIQVFQAGSSHTELVVAGPAASMTAHMEKVAAAGEIVVSPSTKALLPPDAAPAPAGDGWLLSWRRPRLDPIGPVARRDRSTEDTLRLLPVRLREHLVGSDADPEHRIVNIAFVRYSGLDAILAEGGLPAGWRALDEVLRTVQDAVDEEAVTFLATDLDADGGKVILATGVPTTHEDDEGRILRAARRIADADLELRVQIGVNRGHVYAGEIGTAYRCAYTVMGDTVNLAARLMAAAGAGQVYAAPAVLDGSRTAFAATALEPFAVKGKAQPVHAWSVGPEVGDRPQQAAGGLALHGRADELDAVRRALAGEGDVLTVVGAPGMGKTRLVVEALTGVPDPASLVLRGDPYGAAVPYRALRYPMRRMLGLEGVAPAAMGEELLRAVRALDPTLVPYVPLVADVVHAEVHPTPEVDAIAPEFRRRQVADVIAKLLARALPVAAPIVVDDAHWLDEASTELMTVLTERASEHRRPIVVLRRNEPGGFTPPDGDTLQLEPLSDHDSEALVLTATSAAPLRPDDVARVVDRGDGNPMYLVELVRAIRGSDGMAELPESLDGTVAAQIDRLAPLARRVLRLAAVLGRAFPRQVFDAVLGAEGIEVDRATETELAELLESEGQLNLRFRNALLQEVGYEALPYGRRAAVHALAGDVIERLNGDNPDRAADVLGLHFERGRRFAEAWRYARVAGDVAVLAHANAEAAVHYDRALRAARRLDTVPNDVLADVWTRLGQAREQSGAFDLALDAFRRAARLVRGDAVAEALAMLKLARARERAGAYRAALADVTAGLRRLTGAHGKDAATARARLLAFRAVIRQGQGRMGDALAAAVIAAEEAEPAGDGLSLASAYAVMDWIHLVLGEIGEVRMGPVALEIYEELGDLEGQGKVMNTMGAAAYYRGQWDDAIVCYGRARELGLRTGNHVQAAISEMNIGEILVNQGRFEDAETSLHYAIRVFHTSGYPDGQALAECYLGRSLLGRGDLPAARDVLEQARAEFENIGIAGGALEASVHLADCHVRSGDPVRALELLDDATARAQGDLGVLEAAVARVRATALAWLGCVDEAAALVAVGLDAARRQQLAYEEQLLIDVRDELMLTTSPAAAASSSG